MGCFQEASAVPTCCTTQPREYNSPAQARLRQMMKRCFIPNIDNRGRWARGVWALALFVGAGFALRVSWRPTSAASS